MARRQTSKPRAARSDAAPAFCLTADDELSPPMVMMWACFKNGDLHGALEEFNTIAQDIMGDEGFEPSPDSVVQAAVAVAEEMEAIQNEGE